MKVENEKDKEESVHQKENNYNRCEKPGMKNK